MSHLTAAIRDACPDWTLTPITLKNRKGQERTAAIITFLQETVEAYVDSGEYGPDESQCFDLASNQLHFNGLFKYLEAYAADYRDQQRIDQQREEDQERLGRAQH